MRTIPVALQDELNASPLRICRIFTFVRRDLTTFRFTDHDKNITFGGDLYIASSAIVIQAIESTTGAVAINSTIGINYVDGLNYFDSLQGLYDGATLLVSLISWANPAAGQFIYANLILQQKVADEKSYGSFNCKGLISQLDGYMGELYSRLCRAQLGDARCQVNLAPFTNVLTVDAIQVANTVFNVTIDKPDRFYQFGQAKFAGQDYAIDIIGSDSISGVDHEITLAIPSFFDITLGMGVTLIAGCDKELDTCLEKFNNILNRRAEDFVPGNDIDKQPSM